MALESDFEDVLSNVAKESEVRLQLLHRGTQPPDHPMTLPHAESRYLEFHVYRVLRGATKVESGGEGGPPAESDAAG